MSKTLNAEKVSITNLNLLKEKASYYNYPSSGFGSWASGKGQPNGPADGLKTIENYKIIKNPDVEVGMTVFHVTNPKKPASDREAIILKIFDPKKCKR